MWNWRGHTTPFHSLSVTLTKCCCLAMFCSVCTHTSMHVNKRSCIQIQLSISVTNWMGVNIIPPPVVHMYTHAINMSICRSFRTFYVSISTEYVDLSLQCSCCKPILTITKVNTLKLLSHNGLIQFCKALWLPNALSVFLVHIHTHWYIHHCWAHP